jgi:hypothetical protein
MSVNALPATSLKLDAARCRNLPQLAEFVGHRSTTGGGGEL